MACALLLQPWQHPINSLITFRFLCFWYSTHAKRSIVNNDDFSYKQSVHFLLFGFFRSQDGVLEAKQRLHKLRLFRFGMDDSVGVAIRVSVGMTVGVAVLLVWFAVSMAIRVPINVSVGVSVGMRSIAVAVGVSVRVTIGLCLCSLLIKQIPNVQHWRICSPVPMNSSQDTCYLVQFCYAQLVLPLLSSVCMIACRSQRRGKRTGHRGIQSTRRRLWDNCSRRKAVGRRGRQLQQIGPKIQKKTQ